MAYGGRFGVRHLRRVALAVAGLAVATGCAASSTPAPTAASPSPTATAPPSAATVRSPTPPPAVTWAFGGDVPFSGAPGARLAADPATALGPIAGVLSRADVAMVNLETAVTGGGTPAAKQYVFRAPETAFAALRAAGVDVATMANNHALDYGRDGLADTLAAIRAAGFPTVGIGADEAAAYRPWTTTVRGQRLAVIGATDVLDTELVDAWTAGPGKPGLASAKRLDRLVAAVRAARRDADTVVVYLHEGVERVSCPTERQRQVSGALVDAGADVVVGSHAHVLLGGGWRGPAYVDYGLGNFVWYASGSGPSATTGVLTLTTRGHRVVAADWTPALIVGGVPRVQTGATGQALRQAWNGLRACTGLSATPPPG